MNNRIIKLTQKISRSGRKGRKGKRVKSASERGEAAPCDDPYLRKSASILDRLCYTAGHGNGPWHRRYGRSDLCDDRRGHHRNDHNGRVSQARSVPIARPILPRLQRWGFFLRHTSGSRTLLAAAALFRRYAALLAFALAGFSLRSLRSFAAIVLLCAFVCDSRLNRLQKRNLFGSCRRRLVGDSLTGIRRMTYIQSSRAY